MLLTISYARARLGAVRDMGISPTKQSAFDLARDVTGDPEVISLSLCNLPRAFELTFEL